MSRTYATALGARHWHPRRCQWLHQWEGVELQCDDPVVPGGDHCAEHLIQTTPPEETE